MHHAEHIDPEDPVPISELRVQEAAADGDASVVHQQIDCADFAVHDARERCHLISIGNVHLPREHRSPTGANLLLDFSQTALVDIADDEVGTAFSKRQSCRFADAARCPGDQGRLASQIP